MLAKRLFMGGTGGGFLVPNIPFSGALVTRSTDLSVANDTFTVIDWDTEEYDTDGYWAAGSPTKFTIPIDGYYMAGVIVRWKATNNAVAGVRNCSISDDTGSSQALAEQEWPSSGLTGALMHMSTVMPPRHFTAGQWLEATAYQYSSGALDVDANLGRTPTFWILKLG